MRVILSDGSIYEGSIIDDKPEGRGKFYNPNTVLLYDGYWKNGKKHGIGEYYFPNGDKYYGQWSNDMYNGNGIIYWASGYKYKGFFLDNKRQGYGKLYDPNGVLLYNGHLEGLLFDSKITFSELMEIHIKSLEGSNDISYNNSEKLYINNDFSSNFTDQLLSQDEINEIIDNDNSIFILGSKIPL